MQSVGIKTLKNGLSEYVCAAAAGETVLVTDRSQVVAELVSPRVGIDASPDERVFGDLLRQGLLAPAKVPTTTPAAVSQAGGEDPRTAARARRQPDRALIHPDTSMMPVRLFAEDRSPADALCSQTFVASRLLEFEVLNRIHARAVQATHGAAARQRVDRVNLIEMTAVVLGRALQPFARPVRTLDALHLATLDFLRSQGVTPMLASYDVRLSAAALGEGFALADC